MYMSNYFDNKDLFVGPKTTQYGEHMIMTNVVKERKKKYINVDTRFRNDYSNGSSNNADFISLTLPERINEVKKIEVKCIEIPMSFHNISESLGNNVFKVNNTVFVVPDGVYSAATLQTAIFTLFNNNTFTDPTISSLNMVINSTNSANKCYFQNNYFDQNYAGAPITIQFAVDKNGNFDKYDFKSKLGWLLGFRETQITVPAASVDNFLNPSPGYYYGTNYANLNGPRYVYLVIDEFNQGNPHSFLAPLPKSFINKNIMGRVSIDYSLYPYGSILIANRKNGLLVTDKREFTGKVNLQKLGVQLFDEFGNVLNLNGLDFSFCLEIEHE